MAWARASICSPVSAKEFLDRESCGGTEVLSARGFAFFFVFADVGLFDCAFFTLSLLCLLVLFLTFSVFLSIRQLHTDKHALAFFLLLHYFVLALLLGNTIPELYLLGITVSDSTNQRN
jgi:hypothetical protein